MDFRREADAASATSAFSLCAAQASCRASALRRQPGPPASLLRSL